MADDAPLAKLRLPVSDGVVSLRHWRPDDVERIVEICQDELIWRFTSVPQPYLREDAEGWLAAQAAGIAAGTSVGLAVVEEATGRVVGSMALVHLRLSAAEGEVGYATAADARGSGYTRRALELMVRLAFDQLGLERIELRAVVDNVGSRAVAERGGFSLEGVLRSEHLKLDQRRDFAIYSRLAGDPAPK